MYTTAPGREPLPPATRPALRLARIDHEVFTAATGAFGGDDEVYFSDLMAAHGLRCRPEMFHQARTSYTDMMDLVAGRLGASDEPIDLAVLTGVTPDSQPGFPACRLIGLTPGTGLAYSLFDPVLSTPFSALRALSAGLRAGPHRRGALIVLDQSRLLHDRDVDPPLAVRRDAAAVLVFDATAGHATVREPRFLTASAARAGARLAEEAEHWWGGRPGALVCGHGLAGLVDAAPPGGELWWAAEGLPASGIWATVAGRLARWRASGTPVVVADFDAAAGRLSTCLIEPGGDTG